MEFIESPIKYVGSKYKVLNQIIPLFPKDINRFVDLFCGSGVVGANMLGRAKRVSCVDKDVNIIQLLYDIARNKMFLLEQVETAIANYGLSNSYRFGLDKYKQATGYETASKALSVYNKEAYKSVRKVFNFRKTSCLFYVLSLYGFVGAARYNSKGEFNMPVGNRDLNAKVAERYEKYCNYIGKSKKAVSYVSCDFREYNIYTDDFVYADPPYLQAVAAYNNNWNKTDSEALFSMLLTHHCEGGRFALSEFIEHKGKKNIVLERFIKEGNFNVHRISSDYSTCNYHKKDRKNTVEVLVTNY